MGHWIVLGQRTFDQMVSSNHSLSNQAHNQKLSNSKTLAMQCQFEIWGEFKQPAHNDGISIMADGFIKRKLFVEKDDTNNSPNRTDGYANH